MKYELLYIIDPGVEEEARKELIARFSALIEENAGTVEGVEEWGRRRLAYPIDYKTEGYYVLVTFTAGTQVPREIVRNLGNVDEVLRSLVTRIDEKRSRVKPRVFRPVAPAPGAPAAAETPKEAAPPAAAPDAPAPQEEGEGGAE